MLVLGRVTVLVAWIHPWDLSVESRGFRIQTYSNTFWVDATWHVLRAVLSRSIRKRAQTTREKVDDSQPGWNGNAGWNTGYEGWNQPDQNCCKNVSCSVLIRTKWYTRSNWSCFSLPHFLDVYGRLQPWKYNPPGQNNAVKHGDVSSEWLNRNVRLCETCSGSTSSHIT